MPNRFTAVVAAGLVWSLAAGSPVLSAAAPSCDYSFLVRQPIFRLVAPEESGTDVSLVTPIGVATDGDSFGVIKAVELLPESGPIIALPAKFKPFAPSETASHRSRHFANPATVIATMPIPQLRPSTTYDVVFTVKTQNAPAGCPKVLTEHIARFTTESATSLDAIALAHAASQMPSNGKMSAADIFSNALHTLRTLDYPAVISFLVTSRSVVNGKLFVESFRSSVRTSDGVVSTHTVPVSTTNQPENPWGWRVNIPILGSLFPSQRKGNYSQPFGVPEISPMYAFGLMPRKPAVFPGMRTPEPEIDVKSLGRILTVARDYDATLLGVEQYHSRWAYHLKLVPLDRPDFYRVRELWVDTQAFIIWKLRSAGIFESGPATTVPWDAEYTLVDSHWFMAAESTSSTVRTGGFLANTPPVNYEGVNYTFSDFTYPTETLDVDFFSEAKTDAIQY
ncbi:MAG: outer membrane lipoprotein-sorting protein [Candidatus Eremiobacteraeota bacterium]|nr:outer membrane lipoprotein-sorting protein [Candidatus Eremiobacteraeota bacterium]